MLRWGQWYIGTAQAIFRGNRRGIRQLRMTGSHLTGTDHDRKYVLRMLNRFLRFFLTIVVVQNVPLHMTDMATGCDRR